MTIKEYCTNAKPEVINGVQFLLCGTDITDDDRNVDEKTPFDDDLQYSFMERLEKARKEIYEELVDNHITDLYSAYKYYKHLTEEGNCNYWGCWYAVWTSCEPDECLLYDVRMD